MSDSEDPISPIDEAAEDLFGDGDEENDGAAADPSPPPPAPRDAHQDQDQDEELLPTDENDHESTEYRSKHITQVPMYRHRAPKSTDGGIKSLRVPAFLKLWPIQYRPETWSPSAWELENAQHEKPMPEVLFRRDPHTGKLQSNTHLHRWSDGSVTLAVGDEQYEIQSKPLAPAPGRPYQEVQDAHYYAAAAHLTTNSLVIIGHFTEQFSVRPNKDVIDEAVEKLKADLAGSQKNRANEMIITTNEDPELQMKQEELAEKERMRAQRRRETAAARIDGFGGGGGGGRYKGGALSIGDLETGRRGGPAGRKRGAPGGPKNKHRKPEYDSDDELPSGTRRQEEYDLDDGFLVDSDEESGGGDDGEEEEEMLDEDEDDRPAPRAKKRQRTFEPADGDADGEPDHVDARVQAAERSGNHRRRHVINDDDEED